MKALMGSASRLTVWIDGVFNKCKWALFALLCLHFIAAHYWLLGISTWDGLSYRVSPIVELIQHGSLGGWKFNYPAAQHFSPFLELVHLPFLKLLGLSGLYFSFSMVLLPLSIAAVYAFVRELTQDARWGAYSALAFLAIPLVNAQPFSGYIDFAVAGALAYFLYAAIRSLRMESPDLRTLLTLTIATFVFSMARQQTPYVAVLLSGFLPLWFRPAKAFPLPPPQDRPFFKHRFFTLLPAFVVGMAPAAAIHLRRFLIYGTPIYPYRFQVLGIGTDAGLTAEYTMAGAGLIAPGWRGMLASFMRGWIWPAEWPGNFYDSRILGVGLLFWVLMLCLPIAVETMDWNTGKLMLLLSAIAVVAQDFWLPRWSMGLILVLVLGIGGALAASASKGWSWNYFPILLVVLIHLARPIYDTLAMTRLQQTYYRVNVADSPAFIDGQVAPGELTLYPDLDADFLVVHPVINEFSLLLYGRELTNRIVGTLDPAELEGACPDVAETEADRRIYVVDQMAKLVNVNSGCRWECAIPGPGMCLAGGLLTIDQSAESASPNESVDN